MKNKLNFDFVVKQVSLGTLQVVCHSAMVDLESVFVLLPPALPSGSDLLVPNLVHLEQALSLGAPFVICAKSWENEVLPVMEKFPTSSLILVDCSRQALGELAKTQYKTDKKCPTLIAITGTNGKTTEAYLLERMFTHAGYRVGVIGTVSYRWPGHEEDAPLTTPGCLELHKMLADMKDVGVDFVFMEVSSHALDQNRIAGLNFSGALFTNLTQDHLDYHPSMEHYFKAKSKLFFPPHQGGVPFADKKIVCNMDDVHGLHLLNNLPQGFGYGLAVKEGVENQIVGQVISHSPAGLELSISFMGKKATLRSSMVGMFNAHNILGALSMALAFNLPESVFKSLENFAGVPGRLQKVLNNKGVNAFVDYAHTPDALLNVLETLQDVGFKRIVTVFGCGGNRDRGKRPLMGKVVAKFSHVVIVTSDNPRKEDPQAIIDDILPGLADAECVIVEADRRKAIQKAVAMLAPDDVLLIAGKGHETYQIIGQTKFDFSDMQVAKEFIA